MELQLDQEIRITLRLPADLRDRIAKSAAPFKRSMNAEILLALNDRYPDDREQLRAAIRVIDAEIEKAPAKEQRELHELRGALVAKLYFEPIEAEGDSEE